MPYNFLKKIFSLCAIIFLTAGQVISGRFNDPATISIANRIPNLGLKIGFGANSKCGKKVWNSFGLPEGKLTQTQGTLKIAECDKGKNTRRDWQDVFIDVINKNNQHKRIAIPAEFACIQGFKDEKWCIADNLVIFFKTNAEGKVEVHRARLDYSRKEIDDRVITFLQPWDYQ